MVAGLFREEAQRKLVLLWALGVKLKIFYGLVAATLINGDTDGTGLTTAQTDSLNYKQEKLLIVQFILIVYMIMFA